MAEVIERTLTSRPAEATHWSLGSKAKEAGLSHRSIWRSWGGFGLQPHRAETFKLSSDPHFVEKVRDSVGLYLSPPDRALVLCVDERSQIQALDRSRSCRCCRASLSGAATTTSVTAQHLLFAALDVTTGSVIGNCYRRHRAREFLDFLKVIDRKVPDGLDIQIVMDNYATHKTDGVKAWLARRPHWHLHFTPTSASWLNQVERWFAELTRKQLQRGVHRSTLQLETDKGRTQDRTRSASLELRVRVRAFIETPNQNPRPFKSTRSADPANPSFDILAAVKRFCLRVEQNLCHQL